MPIRHGFDILVGRSFRQDEDASLCEHGVPRRKVAEFANDDLRFFGIKPECPEKARIGVADVIFGEDDVDAVRRQNGDVSRDSAV